MEYVIDTHALRVRLAIDGRTHGLIAKDAKLPVGIIDDVLASGKAEKDVIEKIRLAVRPNMRFGTICPADLQENDKGTEKNHITILNKSTKEYIKRTIELSQKIQALCNEYSVMEVFTMIEEWKDHILYFLESSGFNLLELLDESMADVPEYVLNENGEVVEKAKEGIKQ